MKLNQEVYNIKFNINRKFKNLEALLVVKPMMKINSIVSNLDFEF